MNSNQKTYLLPHKCMYIGWGLFVFSFIYLFALLYFANMKLLPDGGFNKLVVLLYIILLISALLVAFSKEKIEDEFVQSIRFSSIVITAYVSFIVYIVSQIFLTVNRGFEFLDIKHINLFIQSLLRNGVNPINVFMLYVVIFRTRMYKYHKSCKNEE